MPISDKNRKILWAKSGNRCAICRQPLVVDATVADSESVVGDECHIVSGSKGGPRYESNYPQPQIDDLPNLLLLCRVHHKMIDDQVETYTADILRGIKGNHETWVDEKLKDEPKASGPKIRRIESEIPKKLPAIFSGKDLLGLATGCLGAYHDYSDDLNDDETDLVGGFIQNVSDWIDIADGLEPAERIRAARSLDDEIKELNSHGFIVFAAVEKQKMEGGIGAPSTFRVLHLSVKRETDSGVITTGNEGA